MALIICQIHIGALLASGFLFAAPVSSKPAGSIELLAQAPEPPLPSNIGDATPEIKGISIFWIILPLFLACMTHPIGSPCGFDQAYRHQIRIGPLMCLFDSLHIPYELYNHYRSTPSGYRVIHRIRRALGEVVVVRLRRHRRSERDDHSTREDTPPTSSLLCRFEKTVHNTCIRHVFSIVLILRYVKLCGFYGIPVSFSLGTVYFVSWVIMEVVLLVGEGCIAMDPGGGDPPAPGTSSPIISELAGGAVSVLQTFMILAGVTTFRLKHRYGPTLPHYLEKLPISYIHWVTYVGLLVLPQYWMFHMGCLYIVSGLTVRRVLFHSTPGLYFVLICIISFAVQPSSIFNTPIAWMVEYAVPYVAHMILFYAPRSLWPGVEGGTGQLWLGLVFSSWAFIYAEALLLFYIFHFNPEGTWKADWTESLP